MLIVQEFKSPYNKNSSPNNNNKNTTQKEEKEIENHSNNPTYQILR